MVASDRVAGAELLQKDIAKRRREAREAAEALRRAAEAPDEDEADAADALVGEKPLHVGKRQRRTNATM